jgi:hypothetical protein
MPDAGKIVLLLRNTLITLNDAIQTGNFTVLRDRAAPSFRDANSAARLSQAFADPASHNIDLSSVAVISPQLTEAPGLDQKTGMLRLKGYFPGQPVQINFEILFQVVDGRWRLFGLSVQPSAPAAPADGLAGNADAPQGHAAACERKNARERESSLRRRTLRQNSRSCALRSLESRRSGGLSALVRLDRGP